MQQDNSSSTQYHADTSSISKSGLDLIAKAPALYWERYLNPEREPEQRSEALIMGSAFHTITLEPDKFAHEYAVLPEFSGEGSVARKREWQALNEGKDGLSMEQYNTVRRMRDAVMKHPIASVLVTEEGPVERNVRWTDLSTNARCKCRPDKVANRSRLIVDLKSTEDASEDGFARSIWSYRYHVQAAFYLDGLKAAGVAAEQFVFIAVEKKPPFLVNVFFLHPDDLALGRQTYQRDLATYVTCVERNEWPGYSPEIKQLRLPAWAYKRNQ